MATIYSIQTLKYKTSLGGKTNVVDEVTYNVSKTTDGVTAKITNFVKLDTSDLSNFTSWDSITKDKALGWVSSALTDEEKVAHEEKLDAQITKITTPEEKAGVPWVIDEA